MGETPEVALLTGQLARVRETLAEHDVRLAVVFGSAAAPERDPNDIDLAVEFENWRPGDEGYTTVYLDLCEALEEEFDVEVDVVDVHSADDRFAAVILRDGVLVYGPRKRKQELTEQVADAYPSTEEACDRVAAAVTRLEENAR